MVRFYINQIRIGNMKLEDVPQKWQEAVREAIEDKESEKS